ncbi:MAG: actin-binding WH2 domain-containing protein [Oscillatoria sp. PMC 1068.18]|nr:actin-binding WH2 domain-containing protein [Oscillatoria sp. PMC 1076.18]MEC4988110.1 actin-binding WH2 domain-containing protein [Oscillatoria sp. PMC 1068.18]
MNHFTVLMRFLRDRDKFLDEIEQGKRLEKTIVALLICSSLFFAFYGAIMGSFSGGLQIFASAVKLPALYLLTLIICLPTLFFYDVISGSKRTFAQYLTLLLAAMAIISVMLFGFAPVTLFFRLSINDYQFFTLLNVVILTISGIVGVRFFYRSMIAIAKTDGNSSQYRTKVIRGWLVLYGFVGSQLGWTLRPFFGDPDRPFALFRNIESNFYFHLLQLIGSLLGIN